MSDTSTAAKTEESEPVRGTLPSAEKQQQQEEGEAEGPSKRQLKKQARRAALAEKYGDHKNGPQQQQHQGTQNSSNMHDGPCSRQQRSSRASRQAKATAIAFEARKKGILEALRCDQLQQQQQQRHLEGGGENSSPNGTVSGSSDNNNSSDRTAADVSSSSPTAAAAPATTTTMMIGCDRSPKGSVDVKCYPLISLLNRHPDYVTTSSCSGRIAIFHRNPPPQPTHPQPQEHNGKTISSAVGAGPSAVVFSSSPRCGCEEEQNRNVKGEGESQGTSTITTTTTTTGKRGTEDAAGWLTVWHDTIPDSLVDVLAVELMQDRVMPSWSEGEETAAGKTTRRREPPTDLTTSQQQREAEGEEPNEEDISVQRSSSSSSPLPTKGDISFLFEPFLMHVQCRTLSAAVRLQQIVLRMYRNSGLVLSSTFLDNDDEDEEEDEANKPNEGAVTHSAAASGNRVAVVGKAAQGQKKKRKATAAPPHRLMLAIRPSPGFNIQVPLMKDGIWLLQEGTQRSKESTSSVGVSYVSQLLRLGNQRMAENEERLNSLCRMIESELFSSSAN